MCGYNNINNSFNNGGFDNGSGTNRCSNCTLPNSSRCGSCYVPVQSLRTVYSPSEGLANGTMFPELLRSYYPDQSLSEMNYLKNYNERRCQG